MNESSAPIEMSTAVQPTRAFSTGIHRTIRGSMKRFLSILTITALGVSIMCGLRAGCEDLRASADTFFDAQGLYDIKVQSTLGLTEKDVDAIAALARIDVAEGVYAETAYTAVGSMREKVQVQSISRENIDQVLVLEGELPEADDEVAVTQKFLKDSGKAIGDTITFSASRSGDAGNDAAEVFMTHEYTITASVQDPTDIMADTTTNSFRATSAASYGFYVDESAATASFFTAIHVTVEGASALDCYAPAYTELVDKVKDEIDEIREEREAAREEELTSDAREELDQREKQAEAVFTRQENQIALMPDGAAKKAAQEELARQRAEVQGQIDDARAELSEIGTATWYIQDRTSIASYSSVDSDTSSIESIATVFPLIFFVVAVLVSLTTATRMVEEERTLIGLYKALGYSKSKILSKYLAYSLSACLLGGLIGNLVGYIALPAFLFSVFKVMYDLPSYDLHYDLFYSLVSVGLFALGIVGATVIACRHEMAETPASLMRPKAPKAGSRILLERISPLWRHMGFLGKVTARNLFRYKKRFFMTVFGIAGCTALIICGMGIRDTVEALSAKQYGAAGVTRYDLMAVATTDDYPDAMAALVASGDEGERDVRVTDYFELYIDNVTLTAGEKKETVQLYVVPDAAAGELDEYLHLVSEDSGETIALSPGDAVLAKSAQGALGAKRGGSVQIQDSTLATADVEVSDVALVYLGNMLFMTQSTYEDLFDATYAPNAALANLDSSASARIAFAHDIKEDGWITVGSTDEYIRDFEGNFTIVNAVVVLITAMAACLSFVVVFTLSNTNISERERELATIKVLGFRRPEVHSYVNKETLILTAIGAVLGIPLGYILAESFTYILQMPSLFFDVEVELPSYVFAVGLAFVFTFIVNLATNRTLNRIDMVGALKSTE